MVWLLLLLSVFVILIIIITVTATSSLYYLLSVSYNCVCKWCKLICCTNRERNEWNTTKLSINYPSLWFFATFLPTLSDGRQWSHWICCQDVSGSHSGAGFGEGPVDKATPPVRRKSHSASSTFFSARWRFTHIRKEKTSLSCKSHGEKKDKLKIYKRINE